MKLKTFTVGLLMSMVMPATAQVTPPAIWSQNAGMSWEQLVDKLRSTAIAGILMPVQSNGCAQDQCLWTIFFRPGAFVSQDRIGLPMTMDMTSHHGKVIAHTICNLNNEQNESTCRSWEGGNVWIEIKQPDGTWDILRKDLR